MRPADMVVQRPQGLYCPAGDFYIDPLRAVSRAVVTHAHADHARRGHGAYLCATPGLGVLRQRLGRIEAQGLAYGEATTINGVRLSLHPAGHVLGSAQVRLEHRGQVWVVSGDYFNSGAGDRNPTCAAFEPQRCHCFVTESTFALPLYRWRPQQAVLDDINAWWRANADAGLTSVLLGYSLGKTQRVLAGLEAGIGSLVVHEAVDAVNQAYRAEGVPLPATRRVADGLSQAEWRRAMVLTAPGTQEGLGLPPPERRREAFASGWMQLRRLRRRAGPQRGFALSDHADWPGLLQAIGATGAERVIVTHGQEETLVRVLQQQGLDAQRFDAAWSRAAS